MPGPFGNTSRFLVEIPEAFIDCVMAENGAAWLASLPAQLGHFCRIWKLTPDGPPRHGYLGLAFPVLRAGVPLVLKLTRVDQETFHEAAALRAWDGRGAVHLLDASAGVLLLERLDASRTLAGLEIEQAISVAARLLRRLTVPTDGPFLDLSNYAIQLHRLAEARWERFRPFPLEWLALPEVRSDLLVNQDLHYENVLASLREPWLVIDPKPLRGDPEFAVAPLLWNRYQEGTTLARFEQIVSEASLDRDLAMNWTVFRVLEYWLWALDRGLTEDPPRCRALAAELLQGQQFTD